MVCMMVNLVGSFFGCFRVRCVFYDVVIFRIVGG